MTQYSLLFPGQGSQYVGMAKSFFESSWGLLLIKQAESVLGFSLKNLMILGPQSELTKTAIAQPAILLHSYAAYLFLRDNKNISISSMLGHSLGEYSALLAAGVMSFEDALMLVHKRGLFMQEAVPQGAGAMAAVLGLDAEIISRVLEESSDPSAEDYAACANFNGPFQTVIAGTKLGIKKAEERLKSAGAKRIIGLDVSAPFHCALMKPVEHKMAEVLSHIKFKDALIPVISNVSAEPEINASRIKSLLLQQITQTVRFTECVKSALDKKLVGEGFIEVGPKNILSSIVRKINSEVFIANIDSAEDRV